VLQTVGLLNIFVGTVIQFFLGYFVFNKVQRNRIIIAIEIFRNIKLIKSDSEDIYKGLKNFSTLTTAQNKLIYFTVETDQMLS